MLTESVSEHSVVRLKDGREGTVVHVCEAQGLPRSYMMEFLDEEFDFVTVAHDQVEAVIWSPPSRSLEVGA